MSRYTRNRERRHKIARYKQYAYQQAERAPIKEQEDFQKGTIQMAGSTKRTPQEHQQLVEQVSRMYLNGVKIVDIFSALGEKYNANYKDIANIIYRDVKNARAAVRDGEAYSAPDEDEILVEAEALKMEKEKEEEIAAPYTAAPAYTLRTQPEPQHKAEPPEILAQLSSRKKTVRIAVENRPEIKIQLGLRDIQAFADVVPEILKMLKALGGDFK